MLRLYDEGVDMRSSSIMCAQHGQLSEKVAIYSKGCKSTSTMLSAGSYAPDLSSGSISKLQGRKRRLLV